MVKGCQECIRLWGEYSAATAEHIKLEDQLRRATLLHDSQLVAQLTPRCEAAAEVRMTTRQSVLAHEEAHGSSAASA